MAPQDVRWILGDAANLIGRPRKIVDEKKLMRLAANCCTNQEIARVLGVSEDTLTRRFADLLERGRAEAKAMLRSWQRQSARRGNSLMLKWLGQQWLSQSDKQEQKITGHIEHEYRDPSKLTDSQLEEAERLVESAYTPANP
jgi:DNA-binding Lrp family transcriptional regulator